MFLIYMQCCRTYFMGSREKLPFPMMDGILIVVIVVAVYFLFLIICHFVGKSQAAGVWADYVQMSLVPEWICSKTWKQDLEVTMSEMRSSLLLQMQRGYLNQKYKLSTQNT